MNWKILFNRSQPRFKYKFWEFKLIDRHPVDLHRVRAAMDFIWHEIWTVSLDYHDKVVHDKVVHGIDPSPMEHTSVIPDDINHYFSAFVSVLGHHKFGSLKRQPIRRDYALIYTMEVEVSGQGAINRNYLGTEVFEQRLKLATLGL